MLYFAGKNLVGGFVVNIDLKELSVSDYELMEDESLVELVHEGDSAALEYLINKYKNFVRAKARSYFLIGADREDIIQEGMIGLYKAIRDFKEDKLSSFKAFAELCITASHRQRTWRQSCFILNNYLPLPYCSHPHHEWHS